MIENAEVFPVNTEIDGLGVSDDWRNNPFRWHVAAHVLHSSSFSWSGAVTNVPAKKRSHTGSNVRK